MKSLRLRQLTGVGGSPAGQDERRQASSSIVRTTGGVFGMNEMIYTAW
jgi:hypothetical protein